MSEAITLEHALQMYENGVYLEVNDGQISMIGVE